MSDKPINRMSLEELRKHCDEMRQDRARSQAFINYLDGKIEQAEIVLSDLYEQSAEKAKA